jgi:type IV pilus assembly protein PilE
MGMSNRSSFLSSRHGGFTLIELMITCGVLAIIVAVAVPTYQRQVHKARRTDARNALLDLAGREERWLSVANSYTAGAINLGYTAFPQTITNGYYSVTVQAPDPSATNPANATVPANPSFIITATAVADQLGDTDCRTFTVNQVGQQVASNSAGVTNTTTCWGP